MALEAKNLSFSYGKQSVLQEFSMSVRPGCLTMLLGPNGSGKTTVLNLLNGYLRPFSGCVMADGVPLQDLRTKDRAKMIAVAEQTPPPVLDYTVREIVMTGLYPVLSPFSAPSAEICRKVDQVLEELELSELQDRSCRCLSGGERQRVTLASVLVTDAAYLLLDEITSALDPAYGIRVMELLKARSAVSGVLVLTHDLSLALRYADEIILLHEGKIHASGTPQNVLTPEHIRSVYGCSAETGISPKGNPYLIL